MKILIVSQYYPPELALIPSVLAERLADLGHSVKVLTGFPNYPEGKLYAGYKQSWRHQETHGRITIKRVPMFIDHSQNPLARIASYVSFAIGTILASSFARGTDVVYVYATQMTAAAAPHIWRRTYGIPYVLHVQDLWPESIIDSSLVRSGLTKKLIVGLLTPWLSAVYRRSSAVIAIAPTMRRMLLQRQVPNEKLHTVLNWADDVPTVTVPGRTPKETRGVRIVYAGNLGDMQDLETVLEAARLVQDLADFRIVFVGTGVAEKRLKQIARDNGLENVEFYGRVEPNHMDSIYAESDFQLVTLKDIPIFRGTIPSKLQGSLAHGVPVITTVAGDVTAIVHEEGVGLTAPPENATALAAVFREAHSMPNNVRERLGKRGRDLYLRSMSAHAGVVAIEAILIAAVNESNDRGSNRDVA